MEIKFLKTCNVSVRRDGDKYHKKSLKFPKDYVYTPSSVTLLKDGEVRLNLREDYYCVVTKDRIQTLEN